MPVWLQAGMWGFLAGAALLLGAAISYFSKVPQKLIGLIMAFGSGVLISALAFELVDEAYEQGGLLPTVSGFVVGALIYTLANWYLGSRGAKHRKRSSDKQPTEESSGGSGLAIAVGALLDGIPESIVIGLSLLGGGKVSLATVAAIFLSNLPEGLSSAAGMKKAGRGAAYIFGVWGGIAVISGVSALLGFVAFADASPATIAVITALAAGAILSMISDTMIPEAFEEAHVLTGLITGLGFLVAFAVHKNG